MSNAFKYCNKLKNITLPKNLENVINVEGIFTICENLIDIDLSPFNGTSLKVADYMFQGCYSLRKVVFPIINADSLSSTLYMFSHCDNLNKIDMSNFYTSQKLNNLQSMFYGCESLTSLDISHLTINNTSNLKGMFDNVHSNISIIVNKNIAPALKDVISKFNITYVD